MYTENQIDEAIVTARLPRHLRRKQRQTARQERRALQNHDYIKINKNPTSIMMWDFLFIRIKTLH